MSDSAVFSRKSETNARRRRLALIMAGAALVGAAPAAQAATFVFSGGNYVPGTTAPQPLQSPDILEINTGANKFIDGVTLTNQSGTVNWSAGTIFFQNGGTVNNQSLWNMTGNNGFIANGGGANFNNSGIFRKSGGTGSTSIGGIAFTNSGTIDAQVGTILFNGGSNTFNAGTAFTGAGVSSITGSATFAGAISSANLDFDGGVFTGNAAVLSGAADWNGGTFTGGWTLANGTTLNALTGANKFISAGALTNNGTFNWQAGTIFLQSSATVNNNGLWVSTADTSLVPNGGATTFNNNGTFRKSAGTGTTGIGGITFVNNGIIDAQTGTIAFTGGGSTFNTGSSFSGAGTVSIASNAAFNGALSSANLDFTSGVYTGNNAALSGTADFVAGNFAGTWALTAGSTLNAIGGGNKFLTGAAFTNSGTIDWQGGALFLENGSTLLNNGTVDFSTTASFNSNGGAVSTITNAASGTFMADTGATATIANTFVNNGGTITANGTFNFNNGTATFNNGTVFNGTGTNRVSSNAGFGGGINSTNLLLDAGVYTGSAAVLNGTAAWAAGNFAGTWTLSNGSTLTANTGSNKFLSAATFTNNGTVAWQAGALFLENGSSFTNNGLVDYTTTTSLTSNGGAVSTITNASGGTFRTAAGTTVTMANTFVNNGGRINANGIFNFSNGTATFNTGTIFDGGGVSRIANNATFNGAISATNLVFASGTYTGGAATLSGAAAWESDTFAGTWQVASGATLTATTGSNKFLTGAAFTNNGTIAWQGGLGFFQNGSTLTNNGSLLFQIDTSLNNNGGAQSNIVNNGLIRKTGGTGTTTLASGIGLTNNGTIDARSGTIALPANFVNAGTLTGNAAFSVSGTLTNNGTVAPGVGVGTVNLNGNYAQSAQGSLAIQLTSLGLSDLFAISGTAALNGGLSLFCTTCSLNAGDTFTLLDSIGDLTGSFASVSTNGFLDGFAYNLIYDTVGDRVQLVVTNPGAGAVPEPATWAMLIAGFGMIGGTLRRRARFTGAVSIA